MILQPGDAWVVGKAVSEGEGQEVAAALRTCHLRGWVEIQSNAVPHVNPGSLRIEGVAPIYKLTEAGWNVIHRSHEWVVATFIVVTVTLIATILGIFIADALTK